MISLRKLSHLLSGSPVAAPTPIKVPEPPPLLELITEEELLCCRRRYEQEWIYESPDISYKKIVDKYSLDPYEMFVWLKERGDNLLRLGATKMELNPEAALQRGEYKEIIFTLEESIYATGGLLIGVIQSMNKENLLPKFIHSLKTNREYVLNLVASTYVKTRTP